MNYALLIGAVLAVTAQHAAADVWIPDGQYAGFYDSAGVYQVVGAVKNSETHPVIPSITVTVQDGPDTISQDLQYVSIMPSGEMPFKIALPDVKTARPVLLEPEISFVRGIHQDRSVGVIYDESLAIRPDGSITGRMANSGTAPVSDIVLLAVVHGRDGSILDVSRNAEPITHMGPGEVVDFVMHPDPAVRQDVSYYSCFAIGDLSVITLNARRDGGVFPVRYDSQILISYPEFDRAGESLSFRVNPGWPFQTAVNLEFPKYSDSESFDVFLNDERIDSIQSVDEMGNWHVSFGLEDQSSGTLVVSGFDPDAAPPAVSIPDWVRNNAGWWSQQKISDGEFVAAIRFLAERQLIDMPAPGPQSAYDIPDWVRNNAGWWSQGLISDRDFLSAVQYLISNGIILA